MSCDQENRQQGNRWQTTCRYSRRDQAAIDAHIAKHLGAGEVLDRVELSPGVALELLLIPPRPEADHDYYTVITRGLGAWDDCPVLVELLVNLPSDWLLDEEALQEDRWGWPVRMLADAARRMGRGLEPDWGTLLSWPGESLAPGTRLCGGVLLPPAVFGEASFFCPLPGGSDAGIFQLIPLYPEELEMAEEEGMDALLARCPDEFMEVIDPRRLNLVLDEEAICYEEELLDEARLHLAAIRWKQLPVEELAAYSHIAVYLGWCIDHGLASEELLREYDAARAAAEAEGTPLDLRAFLRDRLDGRLSYRCLTQEGRDFSDWYNAGARDTPYAYFDDVEDYAREYFGPERFHSPEMAGEAYLFLPCDETLRQRLWEVISRRYACWLAPEDEEPEAEPAEGWHEKTAREP